MKEICIALFTKDRVSENMNVLKLNEHNEGYLTGQFKVQVIPLTDDLIKIIEKYNIDIHTDCTTDNNCNYDKTWN